MELNEKFIIPLIIHVFLNQNKNLNFIINSPIETDIS